jgi:hypothetical protein
MYTQIWAEVPHTSLTGCFGSVNQLILLKIKHLTLNDKITIFPYFSSVKGQ